MFSVQLVFAAIGVLLVALGLPLSRHRVRRNYWFGLRVPSTLADEEVWYAANAATGRELSMLGAAIVVVSLVVGPSLVGSEDVSAAILGVFAGAGAVCVSLIGWRRANRMLRSKREQGRL